MQSQEQPNQYRADINVLLRQIDQRLAESALRYNTTSHTIPLGMKPTPYQSMLTEIDARLQRLQNLQAPLFIENGTSIQRWLKRLANIPIRLVSSKQVIHNQELLDLLMLMLAELERLRLSAAYTTHLTEAIEQQQQQIAQLQAQVTTLHIPSPATESSVSKPILDTTSF
jgi:hypothetical protein